mgnify:CR=1
MKRVSLLSFVFTRGAAARGKRLLDTDFLCIRNALKWKYRQERKGMAYTIKYYLHYGIFERQLFDTIVSWGTAGKVALAVWIAVTLAELFVLWRIHKKGGCTDEKISRPARENGRE